MLSKLFRTNDRNVAAKKNPRSMHHCNYSF